MEIILLRELLLILGSSIVVFFLSNKLKLPAVGGFLTTGVLIGPSGLGLISDPHRIDLLAEIGVMLLLFTVGIEFSIEKLKGMRKIFWWSGFFQVFLTIFITALILSMMRFPISEGIFYGFLVSLSSTALVLRILSEKKEIDTPHGKLSLGILFFQDLSIVPMIVLVPVLARKTPFSLETIITRFLTGIAGVFLIVVIARKIMPYFLYLIVKTKVREAFLFSTLFVLIGMAVITHSFGFTLALGAFIAGLILSESEYSHQLYSDILPFRDLFNSLFFISIGLIFNLSFAWKEKFVIAGFFTSISLLKIIIIFFIVKFFGFPFRIAFLVSLSLFQIGEFSFLLSKLGNSYGIIPQNIYQIFIASSIISFLLTPFIIEFSPPVFEKIFKFSFLLQKKSQEFEKISSLTNHVIIAGFGVNGQNLARVLKNTKIKYIIIDLDAEIVKEAKKNGEPIIFGDVWSPEILREAGIESAKIIVLGISDADITRKVVKLSRSLNPRTHIIVRTKYVSEIDELYKIGADQVIPEEFETSIEIFVRVLEEYHIPKNLIDAQINIIRAERYGMLRGVSRTSRSLEKITEVLTAGTAETFFVSSDSPICGKTIKELNLRKETGASIIAVVRGEKSFASPPPDFLIKGGDTLVLVASHADMDKAFSYLSGEKGS
ncbi:MAG: cation:proton antiporter domain-containing protein [Candidatus Aminicenantia bacterium]